MTTPHPDRSPPAPTSGGGTEPLDPTPPARDAPPTAEPVSLDKPPGEEPLDFDPYRFGKPDHPVPPEYAPPGYHPSPEYSGPPAYGQPGSGQPGSGQPGYPGPPTYHAAPGYPGPAAHQPPPYPNLPGVPPPPQYNLHYPQPRTGNGKAIAALVLGIASIVFCWLTILDVVLIVPAIVFGSLALAASNRTPTREGRGMAIAGLVCAIVGAVLAIVLTVYLYGKVQQCNEFDSGSSEFTQCIRDHI